MRRPLLAGVIVFLCIVTGLLTAPVTEDQPPKIGVDTIEVGPDSDRLWPYTSRARTVESRTLVMNVIVMEDPKTVEVLLNRRADSDWETTDGPVESDAEIDPFPDRATTDEVDWRDAHGSVRYTYVDSGKAGDGDWLKQRYQLHDGTYLGSRDHIRAFAPSEQSRWTALQAHSEYWDWFRLRHTVTDVRGTADTLASDFESMNQTSVDRRYPRKSGPLSRGIVVIGSLLPILAGRRHLSRFAERFEEPTRRTGTLTVFGIALATPLAVRIGGLTLEELIPLVNPKLFVLMLYPLLTVALPIAVAGRSGDLPPWLAGPTAAVGLAIAFAVEFAFLGVTPPTGLVWHRLTLAAALGLLAAGGASVRRDGTWRPLYTAAGTVLWLWGVVTPLFGLV